MSYEWLLIAFPIIFILGWFSARLDIRHVRKTASELPRAYLRGLSHLLSKNEGKALDAFLDAPAIESEPEEFQFTIGELSRRRGEYKRALQVHRRLYERESLPVQVRHRALWELANDYFSMGFIDYAEQHALPLLKDAGYGEPAFNLLLSIYQRRQHYSQALELVESVGEEEQVMRRLMVAQWYCECASALAADDTDGKRRLLEKARNRNADCARANLLLAELALRAQPPEADAAINYYAAMEHQSGDYLWLAVEGVMHAHRLADKPEEGRHLLRHWLENHPSPMLFRCVYPLLDEADARAVAEKYLIANGGAVAATYWAEQQAGGNPAAWLAMKEVLLNAAGKAFACQNCGYEVNHFSWQCRGCLAWESLTQRQR